MADRDDTARIRILEAYERAKAVNPSLTQGQFMRAGAPGSRVKGLTGKFSNDESAARYFRKIKTGERTGGAMYREGAQTKGTLGGFQFRVKLGNRYISQNIAMAGASSTFDIAAVEYELKRNRRKDVEKILARFRNKYGMEETAYDDADLDRLEARPIARSHTPYRLWGGITE